MGGSALTALRKPRIGVTMALVLVVAGLVLVRLLESPSPESTTAREAPAVDPTASPSPGVQGLGAVDISPALEQVVSTMPEEDLLGLEFADVTDEVGLTADPAAYRPESFLDNMSSGIAEARLGGRRVVMLTGPSGSPQLFAWTGERFADITASAGLADLGPVSVAAFGDVDGDGHLDLILGRHDAAPVDLYLNRGDDTFARATRRSGLATASTHPSGTHENTTIRGLALADVDQNGHLDLLVADWNPGVQLNGPNDRLGDTPDEGVCLLNDRNRDNDATGTSQGRLYLGRGDGTFEDATEAWGLRFDQVYAFTPQFVDLDDDGWLDLLLTADFCSSRAYLNDRGRGFVDVTEKTSDAMTPYGMGSALRDLNGDGHLDWLVTSISYPTADRSCPYLDPTAMGCSGNRLWLGDGTGRFTEAVDEYGLRHTGWGWGVAAEDFANSGGLQVAITNGFDFYQSRSDSDPMNHLLDHFGQDRLSFFVQDSDGVFGDVAERVGIDDDGLGHGLLAFDYDDDGRLDLLVNNGRGGPRLWRNVTPSEDRHWITVTLDDPTTPGNRSAWGAEVTVREASGKETRCWITNTTSYQTTTTGACHVGLGPSAGDVEVSVVWPGTRRAQRFSDVPIDQIAVLERSS